MGNVCVLILINEDVAKAAVIFGQHIRLGLEQGDIVQQEIAKVTGVERLQALLVDTIDIDAAPIGELMRILGRDLVWRLGAVFPIVDQALHETRRPAL